MKKEKAFRLASRVSVIGLALALAACGGDDGDSEPKLELGQPTSAAGVTIINQHIAASDGDGEVFPGHANYWDINEDFTVNDGYNDQFDGALGLEVNVDGNNASFPEDQAYEEITWRTPLMTAADGLTGVAVAGETFGEPYGTKSVYMTTATPDVRLWQRLDLTQATGALTLTWDGGAAVSTSNISPATPAAFQVVLRDGAGALLATLYSVESNGTITGSWGDADISAYAGQWVMLSFEATGDSQYSYSQIDSVSVKDGGGQEYVRNGGFEEDLAGWTTSTLEASTNMTSGTRTLNGLDVSRSFYTVPNGLWGRWVDVFRNNSGAPITATISYYSDLGSDGGGIIYSTPNASDKALSTWDGCASDRDLGFVFGSAADVSYTSASNISCLRDGDDGITVTYNVTVPAGGQAAIVNFILMSGDDTGLTATSIDARATGIDEAAAAIVANFWSDLQYRRGMTQEQIDSIINF